MIDLHTHTDRSDGSTPPDALVKLARAAGLRALAITDHDTLAGYDAACSTAASYELELVCAVELSTRPNTGCGQGKRERSAHVLGYFLLTPPTPEFRSWLETHQASRRERNLQLVARLRELGLKICLEDAQVYGCNQVGRPHFAKVLLDKGYVSNLQQAFDLYLADDAQAGVDRDEPPLDEGIRRIVEAGGLASLAHPVRLAQRGAELAALVRRLRDKGMRGIEVFHSEHTPADCEEFAQLARRFDLVPTGGSDFHGDNKPAVHLATGINGNVNVSYELLENMRAMSLGNNSRTVTSR